MLKVFRQRMGKSKGLVSKRIIHFLLRASIQFWQTAKRIMSSAPKLLIALYAGARAETLLRSLYYAKISAFIHFKAGSAACDLWGCAGDDWNKTTSNNTAIIWHTRRSHIVWVCVCKMRPRRIYTRRGPSAPTFVFCFPAAAYSVINLGALWLSGAAQI